MKIIDNSNYRDEYELKCDWPSDIFIQGGSSGVVFSRKNGSYTTAYIEAFPKSPDMFIRGEGATMEDAEKDAYDKYIRWTTCPEHDFKKINKEGMGRCEKCGYMDYVFEPDYTCILCGKHQKYSNILEKYKKSDLDCICGQCLDKKENLKYVSNMTIQAKATINNYLFISVMDEKTFDALKEKPETLEEFLDILSKDSNIYLLELAKRMLEEPDEESAKLTRLWTSVKTYDELYNSFYEDYIERWVKRGYPRERQEQHEKRKREKLLNNNKEET